MSIGRISTPSNWVTGTVASSTWFQNAQDTINNSWDYRNNARYLWVPPMDRIYNSGWNDTTASYVVSITAAGASNVYLFEIPMFYAVSGSKAEQVTAVSFRLKPFSASTVTCTVRQTTNMNAASAPVTTVLGTGSSSGTAEQTVTISGLTATPTAAGYLYGAILSASTGDLFYGAQITYNDASAV